MGDLDPEQGAPAPPMCSYCLTAPAFDFSKGPHPRIPSYTDPPLCLICRLPLHAERQEALERGRRAAEDVLRHKRQARAAEAEYQCVLGSARPDPVADDEAGTTRLPRDLPPNEERGAARNHLLDEFRPVEWLDRRIDDLLDKLWDFWNDGVDPERLARDGWSERGIDVWLYPYRYDIEQAFSDSPERLDAIRRRNEPPTGDDLVYTPVSDQDTAAWIAEQRWIAANPNLWEARHQHHEAAEQLMDRDREARLDAAGFELERVLYQSQIERLRGVHTGGYSVGANGDIIRTKDGVLLPWTVGANGDIHDETGKVLPLIATEDGRIVFDPSRVEIRAKSDRWRRARAAFTKRLLIANAELREQHGKNGPYEVNQERLADAAGYKRTYLSERASYLEVDLAEYQRLRGPLPQDT